MKGLVKRNPSATTGRATSLYKGGIDGESAKYLNKLVSKFGKAIDKSQGGFDISLLGNEDKEKAEQGEVENVRFSKMNSESLENNVDNVLKMSDEEALKNKQEGNFVSIMKRTPGIILENVMEAQNHEVIMRFDAFYLATRKEGVLEGHYHDMGEFMKELPRKLSDPLAILKMDNGRINIFAEFTSEKNKNGIASVELNTVKDINSKFNKYNLVVSVFNAKDNYIKNNINKHGVSVEYKKEDLTQVNPQLYEWLAIVNDKSSNNSISENTEKINSFDEKIDDERKSISKLVDNVRYSKSKAEKFMPGRHANMQITEELVKGYEEGTLSSEDALRKLNALGYKTGINADNVLDMLEGLMPEIREFATSEREAYRESNKKEIPRQARNDVSEDITEVEANEQAKQSLDYWVRNGDYTQGTVRYVQNGKVKVKLAQTANEVQLAKFINNHIMSKSYTNKDVKTIIDNILSDINIWGGDWDSSYMAKLKGADMTSVKKQLWATLNTAPEGERIGPALDIADYIVKHGILTEVIDVTDDVYYAQNILDTLKGYMHKIDVSHIKGDIEAKYDKDRSPFTTWALKKNATERGYTADEVGLALEDVGVILSGDRGKLINEADIFIAMHELYKQSRQVIKNAVPSKGDIVGYFNAEEINQLKQKIAKEILASYETYGKETTFSRVEKKYKGQIESLKNRVKEVHEVNRIKNAILYEAQKFIDSKKGKYHNSTQVQDEALKGLKSLLGRIKYRSNLNRSSTRAIINELAKWYNEDNPVLQNFAVDKGASETRGLYSPHIKTLIDLFLIESGEDGQSRTPVPTIEIKKDSELAKRIESADKSKYTVIRDYLVEKFYGQEFILSDGKKAIMDKRDAQELSHKADDIKTTELANLKEIVEQASFDNKAEKVNHNKFDEFYYYALSVKVENEIFDILVNVGRAKNDGKYHIYDITKNNKKRRDANQSSTGLSRPVGNAIKNASSNSSITENDEIVKVAEEKRAHKAEKPLDVTELEALNTILHHMNFVFETYGKIWRNGRWVDAPEIAKGQIAHKKLIITKKARFFLAFLSSYVIIKLLIGAFGH